MGFLPAPFGASPRPRKLQLQFFTWSHSEANFLPESQRSSSALTFLYFTKYALMALPPSRPALHSRSYTSGLWVCGGLIIIGASGVGRSSSLSSGGSSSKRSRPSSLCIGWSDGKASGRAETVEPSFGSVRKQMLLQVLHSRAPGGQSLCVLNCLELWLLTLTP